MSTTSADLIDLSSMDQKRFTSLVSRSSTASQADIQGVWATVSTILGRASSTPGFIPISQAVVARNSTPPPAVESALAELVSAAHEAATTNLCGSILGGKSSESDEYGDYAIFIGELDVLDGPGSDEDKAGKLLKALGLERWLDNSELQIVQSKKPPLPGSLDNVLPSPGSPAHASLASLSKVLSQQLRDILEFRVVTSGSGGFVLHFLLGYGSGGWQGLGGASTWSDE
ncbi:hypothetical protein FRB90_000954 [Tulasnella sp. 427]|nr:hypothetical protein FRB90_000954 [Tulasnella sp. 427]